jgi:dTDP-4-amino-4,6-dideoxygalactose transaminase
MINVTKTYLPDFEQYISILKRAWDNAWITNNGELLQELEAKLKSYLEVRNLLFCSNGTIVLQMALKALNITKEVITTPFSYVATANAIMWEGCTPVFVDIDPNSFCIDPLKIEESITEDTEAILATHVYGLPCEVEAIQAIAEKYNLKVIYDGAHAFGCTYKQKSLLSYGDLSTCSFHATKLFHTVEGGCIVSHSADINEKLVLYRSFGHKGDDYFSIGINGKNSEFHAAMGLAVLPNLSEIILERKKVFELYNSKLPAGLRKIKYDLDGFEYNYSYYPVIFSDQRTVLKVRDRLMENDVNTRRYFFPSLNTLPQMKEKFLCPVSEELSAKVLCLPLYAGLTEAEVNMICNVVKEALQ